MPIQKIICWCFPAVAAAPAAGGGCFGGLIGIVVLIAIIAGCLDACNIVSVDTTMRFFHIHPEQTSPHLYGKSREQPAYSTTTNNKDRTNLRAFVVTRNKSGLELRSEKKLSSNPVIFAPEGSEVVILYYDNQQTKVGGRIGRWCRVRYNGREGWAWGWYLDVR